jgi:hypothetical protein
MRLLPLEKIPLDLWRDGLLRLPSHLCSSYLTHLDRLGLRERSIETAAKDVHGGKTTDETHDHFARRFTVSAGLLQYSTLGPCEQFETLSEAFLSTFSDGFVGLLDIPCGTGAMSGTLVSILTKLREDKVMPRLPLTICVCAGDYSTEALTIYRSLLRDLIEPAALQGITLRWETNEWDATRGDQTARLIDRWFTACSPATEFFVVVSNFSGALHNQGAFAAFSPCFEQILSRLHDKQSTVVWIEPATKSAKTGVLAWLSQLITTRINWFVRTNPNATQAIAESEYQIEHPVSLQSFRTNVVVHRFERT